MSINKINIFVFSLIQISLIFGFKNSQAQEVTEQNPKIQESLDFAEVNSSNFYNIAVIQSLNKITAKSSLLEIEIGTNIKFGKLTIAVHKCWQSALDQKPESKILLEVFNDLPDAKNTGKRKSVNNRIFYGWMISSSPSISGLEHPIYDITAINCKKED